MHASTDPDGASGSGGGWQRRVGAIVAIPAVSLVGWTADGRTLVAKSDRDGVPGLWLVDVATAAWRPLVSSGHPIGAARLIAARGEVVYEQDRDGDEIHQLARVRLADGVTSPLAGRAGRIHNLGPVSPDGSHLAYASNAEDEGRFDVRLVSLDGGHDRVVWSPGGYAYPASFHPDGRFLAAGRLGAESLETELVVVDLATGAVRPVSTPSGAVLWGYADGRPLVAWRSSGTLLLALNRDREFLGIAEWDPATGSVTELIEADHDLGFSADDAGGRLFITHNRAGAVGVTIHDALTLVQTGAIATPEDGVVSDLCVAPDGTVAAFVFQSPTRPPEIRLADLATGASRPLEPSAAGATRPPYAPAEVRTIASFDGEPVQLQVHRPASADARPPVAIVIHGGPEMQAKQDFERHVHALTAVGFVVVRPNIRGSTGFGRRYAALDDAERRLDAVRDLAAIHDWIGASGVADPGRTVLWGMSYGGLISNLALAHEPDRWAAAVVGVAASSIATFLESIAPWRRPLREAEYGALATHRAYLEEIAALNHVDRFRAPVFLVHAEQDLRVPVGESRQLHAALAAVGKEPPLLVFEDDGHHLDRVVNHVRFVTEAIAFLRRVVPDLDRED